MKALGSRLFQRLFPNQDKQNFSSGVPKKHQPEKNSAAVSTHLFVNQVFNLDHNGDGVIEQSDLEHFRGLLFSQKRDEKQQQLLAELNHKQVKKVSYHVVEGKLHVRIDKGADKSSETLFQLDWRQQVKLPDVLRTLEVKPGQSVQVVHGDDPGNYYCEHLFFQAQIQASLPSSNVLCNHHGEPLVGFLHVPSDEEAHRAKAEQTSSATERHEATRRVIGAAIREYSHEVFSNQPTQEFTILLTGYGQFRTVQNNPTGDFVQDKQNIDAAMKHAFGGSLLSFHGEAMDSESQIFRYFVQDMGNNNQREIRIVTSVLPVDDSAISPDNENSIQVLMKKNRVQAVISMGVHSGTKYKVEHHADSGSMVRCKNKAVHKEGTPKIMQLVDNFSLARAIHGRG